MINPYIIIAALLAIAGAGYQGYRMGGDAVIAEQAQAVQDAAKANSELILQLELKRNANTKTINDLRADLAAVRVRVPQLCVPDQSTSRGKDAAAGSGSQPIDAQAAFEKFRRGLESDAYGADEVTEQCRVLRDWAASLK